MIRDDPARNRPSSSLPKSSAVREAVFQFAESVVVVQVGKSEAPTVKMFSCMRLEELKLGNSSYLFDILEGRRQKNATA